MSEVPEKLLVIERRLLEEPGLFHGLNFDVDRYMPLLRDRANHRYVDRPLAETDASIKQVIPYFVIIHADRVWCYVRGRKSGESRLVAKASIGVGGHINEQDEGLFEDVYSRAAARELAEEVVLPAGCRDRVVALLNDDTNDVGRVHLGVVHVLWSPTEQVSKREGVLTEAGFRTAGELMAMRDRMETWSSLCLDGLDRMLAVSRQLALQPPAVRSVRGQ